MARETEASRLALRRAEARNFAPTASLVLSNQAIKESVVPKETPREKIERQRRERFKEREKNWQEIQASEDRYAAHRAKVLAERKAARNKVSFELGWMQSPVTQSRQELWDGLFTSETTEEQKQYIKQCNGHLNEPVRQGEIVLLPTTKPKNPKEQALLDEWLEEAKIASAELSKLLNEEVVTLNRHFELFSHQLDERIRNDGLPTDYYAQVATGVGATSALVEQNLKNIQNVLLEVNDLYASQVAMASRTGGMNYGVFIADRAELFKKLDGSFAMLSKRSVQLPIYTQIKRNLKLSTKSVIHNADEILKTGFVKELGKRIGNIAIGISAARGLGYVGLVIGAASGMSNIYEACKVDSTGNCGKTTTREIAGFIGGWYGGVKGGTAGVGVAIALAIGVTASAPVLAIATIGGAVIGGAIGGVIGSTAGKAGGDLAYDIYEWVVE
ncbi:hypothetical protein AAFX24_17435 [Vibrio mediterranei]|uniref:hypothetical protein n=1 Tax=Vibrio mediterranei TaxID=689 RepID=UPI0038CEF4E7